MDEYGWGLTSAGFRRPTYNELLDTLEHKARELFGATANLTVRSPLGLFLRIFAWMRKIFRRITSRWIAAPRLSRMMGW